MTDTNPRDWGELKRLATSAKAHDANGTMLPVDDVLELIAEVEQLRANFKVIDEALSTVCDERDEAYDLNGKLQKDIDEITSANSELAGWSKAKDEQVTALKSQRDEMAEDAEKWRTLMACERIRIMGRTLDYKHMGVEFWTKHRAAHPCSEFPQDECREHLEEFVRRARSSLNKTGGKTDG